MANALYVRGKAKMLGPLDLSAIAINIRVALLDAAIYTFNAAHEWRSDLGAGIISVSGIIDGKTIDNATAAFKSNPAVFVGVTGATVEAFAMFQDTGVVGTSPLLYFCDTGVTGLVYTPDGSDARLTPNAAGWFAL